MEIVYAEETNQTFGQAIVQDQTHPRQTLLEEEITIKLILVYRFLQEIYVNLLLEQVK